MMLFSFNACPVRYWYTVYRMILTKFFFNEKLDIQFLIKKKKRPTGHLLGNFDSGFF